MLTNDLSLRESGNSSAGITVLNADQIAEQILQQHHQQQHQPQIPHSSIQHQHDHLQSHALSHISHPQQTQQGHLLSQQNDNLVSLDFQTHPILNSPSPTPDNIDNDVGRQRASYTARDKIAMVKKFKGVSPPISIRRFSMQYGIPANTFKHWIVAYANGVPEDLGSLESQSRRRIRPGKFPVVENKVVEFLKARELDAPKIDSQILREMVDQWAKELLNEKELEEFKVTPSWIQRVLRRHALNNVEGIEVVFAAGAELDAAMRAPSSTIPDDADIQQISEKFLSKKRMRDPEEDGSGNEQGQTRSARKTIASSKQPRRSSIASTSSMPDASLLDQSSESIEFLSNEPHNSASTNMQMSQSGDPYNQLEADNLSSLHQIIVEESSAPIHINQALHAMDIISRFLDEQRMPGHCKDLLGQLSAYLHSSFQHQHTLSHVVQQVDQHSGSLPHLSNTNMMNVSQSIVSVHGNVDTNPEHADAFVQHHHMQQHVSQQNAQLSPPLSQQIPPQLSQQAYVSINHHIQMGSADTMMQSEHLM